MPAYVIPQSPPLIWRLPLHKRIDVLLVAVPDDDIPVNRVEDVKTVQCVAPEIIGAETTPPLTVH